jgi:hypothetical protein
LCTFSQFTILNKNIKGLASRQVLFVFYFECSVNARISGTPTEMPSTANDAQYPQATTPDAWYAETPAPITERNHTTRNFCLRVMLENISQINI